MQKTLNFMFTVRSHALSDIKVHEKVTSAVLRLSLRFNSNLCILYTFGYCSSTASLPVRHTARMPDESDAKQILTASPWRTGGRPRTMWMKTTQQDLESLNLSLIEAIDVAQNRPLWRMTSTFGATHSWWCMPEMNE